MVRADVSEVARLEARTFTLAWNAEGFERFLADPGRFAWVAVDALDGVAGYAAVDLDGKTAHLMNFAVRRDVRRKGVGTRLMRELLGALRWRGAKRLYLEVRASNAPAQAFYGRFGFIVRRTRRSYYRDNSEDARVMELRLNRGDT
jgi:ribosomal-protein-alanine N-acetyltransferase